MKVEVIAFDEVLEICPTIFKKIKTYEETHCRISFVCTEKKFSEIYKQVKNSGNNPFALMAWSNF